MLAQQPPANQASSAEEDDADKPVGLGQSVEAELSKTRVALEHLKQVEERRLALEFQVKTRHVRAHSQTLSHTTHSTHVRLCAFAA